MTSVNKHGKKMYQMAWIVEWSLFGMAMALAVFNIMMGWDSSSAMNIFTVILLSLGWIAVAFMELSTIPLAGGLALARWREKPLIFLAVGGLALLSAFTVYEFNEAASYFMTRQARAAVIENENDQERIVRNDKKIQDILSSSLVAEERIATAKTTYQEERTAELQGRADALARIDATRSSREENITGQIEILEQARRGTPELVEKLDFYQAAIEKKKVAHRERVNALVIARESEIKSAQEELARLAVEEQVAHQMVEVARQEHVESILTQKQSLNTQIEGIQVRITELEDEKRAIKTGAFTGGKEAKAEMDRTQIRPLENELTALRGKIEELGNQQLNPTMSAAHKSRFDALERKMNSFDQAIMSKRSEIEGFKTELAAGPDVSLELKSLEEIRTQLDVERKQRHEVYEAAIAPLLARRLAIGSEAAAERDLVLLESGQAIGVFKGEHDQESGRLKDLLINKDASVESLNEDSSALRSGIVERTEHVDLASESVLYYRMAKWFQEGDGLPVKGNYAEAQFKIFGPIGFFFGLVSVALAYLGVSLTNRAVEPSSQRARRVDRKRNKRLRRLETKALALEDRCANQSLELLATRQDAFDAIKSVPQVFGVQGAETPETRSPTPWFPWAACLLMFLTCLGFVVGAMGSRQNPVPTQIVLGTQTSSTVETTSMIASLDQVLNPVVMIETKDGIGSGFFVREDGLLVTNAHVVGENKEVSVVTRQGPTFLGTVIECDHVRDLALVKVEASNLPILTMSSPSRAHLGHDVLAVGTPLGLEWSISKGIISSVRHIENMTILQTDAAMNHGNSGGPLVDLTSGLVLGINTLKANDAISDGIGFAISSDEVRKAFPSVSW